MNELLWPLDLIFTKEKHLYFLATMGDTNHYRCYNCNIQCPKLKADELRVGTQETVLYPTISSGIRWATRFKDEIYIDSIPEWVTNIKISVIKLQHAGPTSVIPYIQLGSGSGWWDAGDNYIGMGSATDYSGNINSNIPSTRIDMCPTTISNIGNYICGETSFTFTGWDSTNGKYLYTFQGQFSTVGNVTTNGWTSGAVRGKYVKELCSKIRIMNDNTPIGTPLSRWAEGYVTVYMW